MNYLIKQKIYSFYVLFFIRHSQNENYLNNHYNISFIQNNKNRTTIKSRLLAQTQNHNPHYHKDPELKEIIDKLNKEAIKKYQQTHDPYEQLQELVEKNQTKVTGRHGAEPMSTTEKELLETYEEMFGDENYIMLKSAMYQNDDGKSSTRECTDINTKLARTKGRDKYLKHLKQRCTRCICVCSVGSTFLTLIGLALAKKAAFKVLNVTISGVNYKTYASYISIFNMFHTNTLSAAMPAGATTVAKGLTDLVPTAAGAATSAFPPYGIAALVLLILAVLLIILYIWLYRRRKNSWKHECKKHLCK
ncbi:hypothetical protein PFFCH_01777 [Plasmodium falciparum FCH/4]|uniref:Stevor n=1 Tax=Plasmodium falciparum FCH/4 TaxID=1036724 RepID=A0A024VSE8_PLAFA|nr:hypothetical protein PFFCH_01777 [Plasmodium falciparum FCH/4]